jgi:hypothetical protein
VKIAILKTLKVITWRLKVIIFQGIKKKGFGFQVKVLLGLGFSLGFKLSTTQPLNGLFLQRLLW